MATKRKPPLPPTEQTLGPPAEPPTEAIQGEVMPRAQEQEAPASPIAQYNPTAAGLAAMRESYAGKVYDVDTPAGMRDAIAARRHLKEHRLALEALRKELKAPLVAQGKLVDSEAERIRLELERLEDPIDGQIKAAEQRKEEERERKEELRRQARVRITARITAIREVPFGLLQADLTKLHAALEGLKSFDDTDMDAMDVEEARRAQAASTAAVERLIETAREQQEERERIARDRAKLEADQADQRKRDQEAADARAKADAEAHADRERLAAEQKAKDDAAAEERRVKQEKEDAQREADAKAAADALAEQQKELQTARDAIEAENKARAQAEQDRQEEARKVREAEDAAQREREAQAAEAERQRRIRETNLSDAIADAISLLIELGQGEHVVTQTLSAAMVRTPEIS